MLESAALSQHGFILKGHLNKTSLSTWELLAIALFELRQVVCRGGSMRSEADRETDVSTGRLTVCVSIVAQPIQQTSSWPDNPVGPETKAEGSYCQRPA